MQPVTKTEGPGFKESFAGLYGATKVSLGRAKSKLTPVPKTEEQRVTKANASVAKRKVINDRIAIGTFGVFDKVVVGPFGVVKAVAKGSWYASRGVTLQAAPIAEESAQAAPVAEASVEVKTAAAVEASAKDDEPAKPKGLWTTIRGK